MSNTSFIAWMALMPPPQGAGQPAAPAWMSLVPFALLSVIIYFMMIRPQQKKMRDHKQMMEKLKPRDRVLVAGGIVATVVTVGDTTVTVRSSDTKLEVQKSAVSDIIERAAGDQ